jgi:hypothetical protein
MTRGGLANTEINRLVNPLVDTFTMSGYVSFITEFGLLVMVLLVFLVIGGSVANHSWSRRMCCWLILTAYLYVQFEGYAFYALPLLVFVFDSSEDIAFHRA